MTHDLEWHENKKLRRMEVAAPEMLDALRGSLDALRSICDPGDPALERVYAAIAKATGDA
jgi:hypothetical protein